MAVCGAIGLNLCHSLRHKFSVPKVEAMRHSKVQIFVHIVWGTWQKQPLVTPEIERSLYRCIENEAQRLRCKVFAIGGIADHVHLVVWMPSRLALATLVKQVKGVSSTFARDQLVSGGLFKWQAGYGAFSIMPSHLDKVIAYVQNQKQHHAAGTIVAEWEETDEEAE
jgi:putative transposase